MATAELNYLGQLRTEALHCASGQKIITDAPIDNHGKGEAFSPTDLLCTSLASCMITIMGIAINQHAMEVEGMRAEVTKKMAENPRRVGAIMIRIHVTGRLTEKETVILERAAKNCPVAKSLDPAIEQNIEFAFQQTN